MIPLFVKQIHASRRMQLIQPEMQKIQAKYKGKSDPESRQAMTQETMDLYKRTGHQPVQLVPADPAAVAVLLRPVPRAQRPARHIATGTRRTRSARITRSRSRRRPSSPRSSARSCPQRSWARTDLTVKIVTVVLIMLMSATTFTTQRQLMMKNMPASALDNPFAKQQKMLLYLMPLFFAISGINFPIGVLLYWLTTNVWSMGQQFYVIRRMPAPGSPAEKALRGAPDEARQDASRSSPSPGSHTRSRPQDVQDTADEPAKPVAGQRQQPKRKKRNRPVAPNGTKPATKPAAKPGAPASAQRTATGGDTTAASRDA